VKKRRDFFLPLPSFASPFLYPSVFFPQRVSFVVGVCWVGKAKRECIHLMRKNPQENSFFFWLSLVIFAPTKKPCHIVAKGKRECIQFDWEWWKTPKENSLFFWLSTHFSSSRTHKKTLCRRHTHSQPNLVASPLIIPRHIIWLSISNQVRLPAELKHIKKRRKRN